MAGERTRPCNVHTRKLYCTDWPETHVYVQSINGVRYLHAFWWVLSRIFGVSRVFFFFLLFIYLSAHKSKGVWVAFSMDIRLINRRESVDKRVSVCCMCYTDRMWSV